MFGEGDESVDHLTNVRNWHRGNTKDSKKENGKGGGGEIKGEERKKGITSD